MVLEMELGTVKVDVLQKATREQELKQAGKKEANSGWFNSYTSSERIKRTTLPQQNISM